MAIVGQLNLGGQTVTTTNLTAGTAAFTGNVGVGGNMAIGTTAVAGSANLYVIGNVGIGTASPGTKLDVVGTGRFSSTLTASNGLTVSAGSVSLPATSIANSALQGSGALTVTAGTGMSGGGSVALGGSVTLNNAGVTSLTGTSNQVTASGSTGAVTLFLPQNIHTGASPTFGGMTTTGATNLVTSSGNVGIGTTIPGYKLDVSGTGRFTSTVTAPTFSGNATTATTATALAANGSNCSAGSFPLGVNASGAVETCTAVSSLAPTLTGGSASGTWGISISGNAATATTATNLSGGTVSATSLNSTGYLTINHSSPSIVFQDSDHRNGVIHQNSNLMYFLSGSGTNGTSWTQNGSYWPLTLNMNDDTATFGGPAYFMEGNVGIGTISPGYKLDVSGNINASGTISANVLSANGIQTPYLQVASAYVNIVGGAVLDMNGTMVLDTSRNLVNIGYISASYGNLFGSATSCCALVIPTLSLGEASSTNGRQSWIQFHNAGEAESYIRLAGGGPSGRDGRRRLEIGDSQSSNTSLFVSGYIKPWVSGSDPWDTCNGIWAPTGSMYVETGTNRGLIVCLDNGWYAIRPGNNDLAEYFPTSDLSIGAGDVVVADPQGDKHISKSSQPYQSSVIGIISTNPGYILGTGFDNEKSRLIALAGKVPVKVTTENGPIKAGDPVTSSSIRGFAMRSSKAGTIVGKAVDNFDPKSGRGEIISCPQGTPEGVICGKVAVFVNTSWFDPDITFTSTGDLEISQEGSQFTVKKADSIIDRIGAFAEIVVSKIRAGIIETKKLIVNGVDVMEKLNGLANKINEQQQEINDLKKTVNSLRNAQ